MSHSKSPVSPSGPLARIDWTPTRAAGLSRLNAFISNAGRAYARDRNMDRGPADRSNVSALSPWIRRRLVTEDEVIAAVLRRHDFAAAEKFIQEVYWRSYWKGWLEMRPSMLVRFETECKALQETFSGDRGLQLAVEGRTGIDCFDAWAHELSETGWLHNHARMWFASIWIFTLRLPWQLGADFVYKNLLDADPASNTLSWRWVAVLHTQGKHYLARASNIRENTQGRFDPTGRLNEHAAPLTEDHPPSPPAPLPKGDSALTSRVAVLLTEEDLHSESWNLEADVVGCACLKRSKVATVEGPAARFCEGALEDGLRRADGHFGSSGEHIAPEDVAHWALQCGVTEVVTAFAPAGPIARVLDDLQQELARDRIRLVRVQRPFDARTWPHAKAGFFKLREKIPQLIADAP